MASIPEHQPPPEDDAADLSAGTLPGWWRQLGPGLITGAADDDPSGIATYSQAGAQFGYTAAWTLLLTYPLMVGIQLACARIGRVTGRGLADNFLRFCPRQVVLALVSLLLLANTINIGANLNAMGDAAALVLRGAGPPLPGYSVGALAIVFAACSLLLQVLLPYSRYVAVLKWLTLSLLAYVAVVLVAGVDWPAALHGLLVPTLRWDKDYLTTIVAILGTTISPYLFFWQAGQEVEEIDRVPEDQALCNAPGQARRQLRRLRLDTLVGMGFSNLVAFFMIAATAATLHAQGITQLDSTAQAASALAPVAGRFAVDLFALGIIGTGLLSLPVLAGSAAYGVASIFGLPQGLGKRWDQAPAFYGVIAAAMLAGAAISCLGLNPIRTLYWSAVINAVISAPIMVAVMLTVSRARVMGSLVLPLAWRVAGWAATAVMGLASLAMAVAMLM
jgi:NRAMP (natural resistance-associated macrophage protein)-like metal ion transporter